MIKIKMSGHWCIGIGNLDYLVESGGLGARAKEQRATVAVESSDVFLSLLLCFSHRLHAPHLEI